MMNTAFRSACLSAAAIATLYGVSPVDARPLQWDATGTSAPTGADGDGPWDLTTVRWVDLISGTNTTFQNGDDVNIGLGGNTVANTTFNVLTLGSSITAGNIVFRPSSAGSPYGIVDSGNGTETFTLNGGIVKTGNNQTGTFRIQLSSAMVLSGGNHVISLADSAGDLAGGELTIGNPITGSGSLELNNVANVPGVDAQFGSLVLLGANSYTGGTNVASGRLIINNSAGLGTGAVNVSGGGFLAFGGPGAAVSGGLNFTNALTISRSDYGSTTDFNRYTSAVGSANGSGVNTISGALTLDAAATVLPAPATGVPTFAEGRIRADTSRIIISSDVQRGPNVPAGTPILLGLDGDNAGFIELTGNNTGISGIRTLGGVQVEFTNENNIGGPNSILQFNGGNFRPVGGVLTSFGTHVLNNPTTFAAGIVVDDGFSFTVDRALGQTETAVGYINKRGLGTLNLNSSINLRGSATFWDAGTVNVNNAVTLAGVRLRSPTVNVGNNAVMSTTQYTSIGTDTFGTNGGPDIATVNLTGNAVWNSAVVDFNVSDNAQTRGTLTLSDTAKLNSLGNLFVAKSTGTVGTVTLNGTSAIDVGGLNADGTRSTAAGSFQSIILGRNTGSASLTNNGGTIRIAGELQVGSETGGTGTFTQTAGSTTVNAWFSTGRFGTVGTTDISGGTFTKQGTDPAYVGENSPTAVSTFTLRGTGIYNHVGTEFWIGQQAQGIVNIQDTASFNTNNAILISRGNADGRGTLNLSGGTLTKTTATGVLAVGAGGGVGTLNQTGGTLNSAATRIGGSSNGVANFSGGTANFTGEFTVGNIAGVNGTLNVSGTANVTAPDVLVGNALNSGGTINLDGGTFTANRIASAAGTGGVKVLNLNGGVLRPLNSSSATSTPAGTPLVGPAITSVVRAGGARIDTNGKDAFITSTLTHSAALGATPDGGLTKSGLGSLRLASATALTYTGPTTVTGGTLAATTVNSNAILAGNGVSLVNGLSTFSLDYTGGTTPAASVRTILTAGYNQATPFSSGAIRAPGLAAGRVLGYNDIGTAVNVTLTLAGDANLDGSVTFTDFVALQGSFGQSGVSFAQGDLNYSGAVDFADFVIIQSNFGNSIAAGGRAEFTREQYAAVMSITNASEVPEPAALSLIGGAAALLGGRRRRKQA